MKVALLFTGSYRSFNLVAKKIYENLVLPNEAICFIYYESDTNKDQIIYEKFGSNVGKCRHFVTTRDEEFESIKTMILNDKTRTAISQQKFDKIGWDRNYIVNSGSMIEYYQFMKCFDLMLEYEREKNVKFDIIARTRLDLFFLEPMFFKNFFENINEELREKCKSDDVYIRSLGSETMAKVLIEEQLTEIATKFPVVIDNNLKIDNLLEFINNNDHIWTFGANNFWIGKREVMLLSKNLIYHYGKYDSGEDFTFNSETQFCFFFIYHNIKRYFYATKYDGDYWFEADKIIKYINTGEYNGKAITGLARFNC